MINITEIFQILVLYQTYVHGDLFSIVVPCQVWMHTDNIILGLSWGSFDIVVLQYGIFVSSFYRLNIEPTVNGIFFSVTPYGAWRAAHSPQQSSLSKPSSSTEALPLSFHPFRSPSTCLCKFACRLHSSNWCHRMPLLR